MRPATRSLAGLARPPCAWALWVGALKAIGRQAGGAALRTAASQGLVSPTLGFCKFALELPAVADPALIVIGLPGLVFITQGPSGQVKHPYESCTQPALPDCFGPLSPPSAS